MGTIFALIDCDNFFVSCERLFRPDLEGRPVVVLSSNDGCVISRSNEAKNLGIPMAAPAFKYRQLFNEQGVVRFSANFELYGDISERLTRVITSITPRTEVYSVDESFLDLSQLEIANYDSWGKSVQQRLLDETGMPVSIGIAPSKTLAKLASEHAKKDSALVGILNLQSLPAPIRDSYLLRTPIEQIWGVGRRLSPRLRAEGVYTALDLAHLRLPHAQQLMGIHGRQLVAELNGQSCQPLQAFGRVRQTVMNGRTFGEDTSQFQILEAAIASLTARAAASLRQDRLLARSAAIHLNTNRHKPDYQRASRFITFPTATADTGAITSQLVQATQAAFNPRYSYHRANVLLYDLVSAKSLQTDLFDKISIHTAQISQVRLQAFDAINARYGKGVIRYAAEDLGNTWEPKHQLRSPRYTTNWQELPVAHIRSP